MLCIPRWLMGWLLGPGDLITTTIITVLIRTACSGRWHGILGRTRSGRDGQVLILHVGRPGVSAGPMIRTVKTSLALKPMLGLSDLLLRQTPTANKAAFRSGADFRSIIATNWRRSPRVLVLWSNTIRRWQIWLGGLSKVCA